MGNHTAATFGSVGHDALTPSIRTDLRNGTVPDTLLLDLFLVASAVIVSEDWDWRWISNRHWASRNCECGLWSTPERLLHCCLRSTGHGSWTSAAAALLVDRLWGAAREAGSGVSRVPRRCRGITGADPLRQRGRPDQGGSGSVRLRVLHSSEATVTGWSNRERDHHVAHPLFSCELELLM